MPEYDWRDRAGTLFECEKQPALGSRGMVVTNHPLASTAGMQMLAGGGGGVGGRGGHAGITHHSAGARRGLGRGRGDRQANPPTASFA